MNNDAQINVKLVLDKSEFTNQMNNVSSTANTTTTQVTNNIKKQTQNTMNSVNSITNGVINKIRSQIGPLANIGTALINAFTISNKTSSSWDEYIKGIKKLEDELDKAKKKLQDLTQEFHETAWNNASWETNEKGETYEEPNYYTADAIYGEDIQEATKNVKELESKLGKTASTSAKLAVIFKTIKQTLINTLKVIGSIVGTLAMIVGIVCSIVNKTAEAGDNIDKMSQKLNMSTDGYQQWSYVIGLAGGNIENMGQGFKTLNKLIENAKDGNEEAIASFQKVGVSLEDLQTLSEEDIFSKSIKGLSEYANSSERAVLSQTLFGRSSQQLAPLLNQNAETIDNLARTSEVLGLNMSESGTKASATLKDLKDTWKQSMNAMRNSIGEGLLNPLSKVLKYLIKINAYLTAFFKGMFGAKNNNDSFTTTSNNAKKAVDNTNKATKAVKEYNKQLMGFDEINNLNSDKGDSSSSSSYDYSIDMDDMDAGGTLAGLFNEDELDKIENFKKKMEEIGKQCKPWIALIGTLLGIIAVIVGICTMNIPLIIGGVAILGIGLVAGFGEDENGQNGWQQLGTILTDWMANLKQKCRDKLEEWGDNFTEWMQSIEDKMIEKVQKVASWIKEKWNNFKANCKKAWNTIIEICNQAWNGITQIGTKVKTSLADFWNKIKEGAKGGINWVIDIVEKGINKCIELLNKLSFDVPSWVPSIGGQTFGFNLQQVQIPRLAKGGIATSSILANIGENGKEAILPLENNTQWMDALVSKINNNNNQPIEITLEVGGNKFGKACIQSINQVQKQNGKQTLKI